MYEKGFLFYQLWGPGSAVSSHSGVQPKTNLMHFAGQVTLWWKDIISFYAELIFTEAKSAKRGIFFGFRGEGGVSSAYDDDDCPKRECVARLAILEVNIVTLDRRGKKTEKGWEV